MPTDPPDNVLLFPRTDREKRLNDGDRLRGDSNELYTPRWIIAALGPIALDPCANHTRQIAAVNFTRDDNALARSWQTDGLVFFNPPYSNPLQGEFVRQAFLEFHARSFDLAVGLIQARTDTAYWHRYIFGAASLVGFPRGRIAFVDRHGEPNRTASGRPEAGSFASALVIYSRLMLAETMHLHTRLSDAFDKNGHPIKWINP